ncbi:MAG: hypothetical protein KDB94_02455 [Acidobacteria bacterium]|nr:hypothetical protein [Acidobacteriota bacterium]
MKTANLRRKLAATLLGCALVPAVAGADAIVQLGLAPAGADASGRVQLYAPSVVESGSSISHWDVAGIPLLMWPALSSLLGFQQTDLTTSMFFDEGYVPGTTEFEVIVLDGPNEGFNDPTPFTPIGGNPATTLGDARRELFNAVLNAWGQLLDNDETVRVAVLTDDLFCNASQGAVLAAAGAYCVVTDSDTAYPGSLGKALYGSYGDECDPDNPGPDFDLIVFLNENIDEGCLGAGTGYYYGLDGNAPENLFEAFNTLLHEAGHGLGFSSFVSRTGPSQGDHFFAPYVGIYDRQIFDNQTLERWEDMTKSERAASMTNGPHVVIDSPHVVADGPDWAVGNVVTVSFPEGVDDFPGIAAQFGAPVFGPGAVLPTGLLEVADPPRGCTAIDPIPGRIALIERGDCAFVDKFDNAAEAGAIGVIVYNSATPPSGTPEDLIAMAGSSIYTDVPALFVARSSGQALKSLVLSGPGLECSPDADSGCLLGGRFQVEVDWDTGTGTGAGQVMSFGGQRAESDQSVFFWFFDPANFEMGVKMVDACTFNDSFWIFASGLTNVEYTITIFDTFTGQSRQVNNPLGSYPQTVGLTDGIGGFDCTPGDGVRTFAPTPQQVREVVASAPADPLGEAIVASVAPETGTCVDDADTACHLDNRFQVEVQWTTSEGTGAAQVMSFGGQRASSDQSSFWWFFDPANFEMGVKVNPACDYTGNVWIYISGLTNAGYTVRLRDSMTGNTKTYTNPEGNYPQTIGDTGQGLSCF